MRIYKINMAFTMDNVRRQVETIKDPVSFDQCVVLMQQSVSAWGDKMDMADFLVDNKEAVMAIIADVAAKKAKKGRRVFKPTTAVTITFEPRKFVEPKDDPQAPLLKRLDKPACRKGMTCCNKKCTFIHPIGHPLAYRNNNFPTL